MHIRNLIILLFCFPVMFLNAQKGYELGGDAGLAYYFGDLNTSFDLSSPGLAFAVKARKNYNERISFTAAFQFAHISGSDHNSTNFFERTRNLDFSSNIWDVSGVFEFNFFPYVHGSTDDYYTPYFFTGFSVLKFNPTTTLNGEKYDLRDFGTEGQFFGNEYNLFSGSWVFGFGFKWDINRDWSLNAQVTGRKLFTDYVDDVSGTYPDFASLENLRGPVAADLSDRSEMADFVQPGMQRGNGKTNDMIYTISFGIMRYFGSIECPGISKGAF